MWEKQTCTDVRDEARDLRGMLGPSVAVLTCNHVSPIPAIRDFRHTVAGHRVVVLVKFFLEDEELGVEFFALDLFFKGDAILFGLL
jgi:hypothetical protein